MNVIIETDRLLLREFTMDDAKLVFELNNDPDVIQYTGDPVRNEAHALEILEKTIIPQYILYNHGRWAVHTKPELEFIGWCGLKFRAERNEIDLGYRFQKKAWGRGYATEAAYASLRYGFDKLLVRRIVGRAMPQNIASIKVLEKLGMRFVCEEIIEDHPALTYEATNPLIP